MYKGGCSGTSSGYVHMQGSGDGGLHIAKGSVKHQLPIAECQSHVGQMLQEGHLLPAVFLGESPW